MKYFKPRRFFRQARAKAYNFILYYLVPDKVYYKIHYKRITGENLNLRHPIHLNEKMHWIKAFCRDPRYPLLSDKFKMKAYISNLLGDEFIVPTIAKFNKVKEIEWDKLPDKFAIKCSHDSASILLCHDKATFDKENAKTRLEQSLKVNYYHYENKQWGYKDIQPCIICEPLLENPDGTPIVDYKFYIYGGELQYFMYSIGEAAECHANVKFDLNNNLIDHYFKNKPQINPNDIILPPEIEKMKAIAQELGKDFQMVRIDMYDVAGHIYIGEFTFYSNGGFINIEDQRFADRLAVKIDLSKIITN